MNVLIVGGAGYIGSHQVKMMCDLGYNVIVFDNLNTGFVEAVDRRAKFIKGDIREYDQIKTALLRNDIDIVIHFAALSLVGVSVEEPLDYYDNNVYGMEILLRAMVDTDVKRIVFSSTAAVYGLPKQEQISEDHVTNPINPYGETKLAMEKLMKWIDNAYGIKSIALRYFNAAGSSPDGTIGELHNPETHLIPIVLQVALGQRDFVSIYGDDYDTPDGTCVRDYIHVEDLCDAHMRACTYLLEGGESNVFNLGYGNGYSVKEIIETCRKVTGHPIPTEIVARRAGDPSRLVASNARISEILGWQPRYNDINYIVQTAYEFHKKYPNGFV